MLHYLNASRFDLDREGKVANPAFPSRDSTDCRTATVSRFLPSMSDHQPLDLGLDSMAVDRHLVATRQGRKTMENRSPHCTIEKNCRRFRVEKYCYHCRKSSRFHHGKNYFRLPRSYRCREKNCRYQ